MSTPQPEPRRERSLSVRVIGAVSASVIALTLLASSAQAATTYPYPKPSRTLPAALDVAAPYQQGTLCLTENQPGAVDFAKLLNATYGTHSYGILRSCAAEHGEGRALDWMIDATKPDQLALANALTRWLAAPDDQGRPGAMARRFGINYIIFNRLQWKAWAPERGWTAYTGVSPHTDHIHFSFNWDGATKRTSWWSGVAVTTPLTGPPGTNSAPSYPRDLTADGLADVVGVEASGGALRVYPSTGTGGWKAAIRSGSGWNAYSKVLTAGTWDADTVSDVIVQDAAGTLYLRAGTGTGTFRAPVRIGSGWTMHNLLFPVADFDGDGRTDLMARRSDGYLYLYRGDGRGRFIAGALRVGSGWNGFNTVFSPGDFTGDGVPDVIGRRSDGSADLYPGNGAGGWLARIPIASDWAQYTALTSIGDFTGDGKSDVLGRTADGRFWVLPGDGSGGVSARTLVGSNWNTFSRILL